MGRCTTLTPIIGILLAAAAFGQSEYFEKRVRPILVEHCQGCHNPKAGKAGLDLTSAAGFHKGADTGPVVIPGDLENSRLVQVTGYRERIKMPPTGKISDEEISVLREWVKMGAPWPPDTVTGVPAKPGKIYSRAQKEFWSFRPLRQPSLPEVKDESWIRSPVDRFVLASLEAHQLSPAPQADRPTLIRRVTFDLTGLPPTEDEVLAFLTDKSPDAFTRVVDRLLASPRYGEKWGRHWLDVARYADSTGADEDYKYPYAWRYRDYVIDAFNRDVPYDRFMREQVAGDLMPPPAGQNVNTDGIVATGFLALGPKLIAEQDKVKMFYDIVDEQIDVAGKAFLGLTISCARCHDHKFDPISTKDYYSLASIFASTKQLAQIEGTVSKLYFAPLVGKDVAAEYEAHQKRIADKQKEIDDVVNVEAMRYRDLLAPRMAEYMLAARRVYADGENAAAVAESASLEASLLQRWVAYLKPTKERRPHLEPWYKADNPLEIATQYQRDFVAEAARRTRAQKEFLAKSEEARAHGGKPLVPPKFLAGENRFYTECVTAKGPLTLPPVEPEKMYTEEALKKLEVLKAELQTIKTTGPPEPPFACAVAEDQPVEQRVFLRGNPDSKGDPVAKRFPTILAGEDQEPIRQGSGRLELANWLSDAHNPLPARVMVNRIWQGHFGQGLVRTPNNFGIAGERPTHPDLLDWMAAEFIRQGWSIKKMHRMILLSSTYQMSADTTPAKREKDPDNRLLSRFSIRRKTVEEIRDSLWLLDGSLDLTMGGTLQKGEGFDSEFSDSRKSIHPDDSNRRTVYLPLRRSNLATLFTLYDFGDATTSTETRSETNVAPQALYMMNSKFVTERSRNLARQIMERETTDKHRVEQAWVRVLGHEPTADEVQEGLRYVASFPAQGADNLVAWTSFCRTLIASNDFIYVY